MNFLGGNHLSRGANVAAWVIAGGLALSYQIYRNKQQNGATMTQAELDAINEKKKATFKQPVANNENNSNNTGSKQ